MQYFDSLVYAELIPELTSSELRLLGDKASTLWLRVPADIDYVNVLSLLPQRKRKLPKALRLASFAKLDADIDIPIPDSNEQAQPED